MHEDLITEISQDIFYEVGAFLAQEGIEFNDYETFSRFLAGILIEYINLKMIEDNLNKEERREVQSNVMLAINQLYDLAEEELENGEYRRVREED